MSANESYDSKDVVVLERDPSTKCIVHLFGAQVISWTNKGEEYIYLSSKAKFDSKTPIRGGIPIAFPCFAAWELGPFHGFARTSQWTVEKDPSKDSKGNVVAVFSLRENEETLKMWNYKFKVVYTVTLSDSSLTTDFSVENLDTSAFSFTCVLHTYFKVPDVSLSTVSNLRALAYTDNTQDGKTVVEDRDILPIDRFVNYIYKNSPDHHDICGVTGKRTIRLQKKNFPDTVIWNPWEEVGSKMADLDTYKTMLCVEAGHVATPIELSPNQRYDASQTFTILN